MKQYQFAAKLAGVSHLNDCDLYDTWADVICKKWGIQESRADILTIEDFYASCNIKFKYLSAALEDFAMHALSMDWAVTE